MSPGNSIHFVLRFYIFKN
uniref:Uncharacterized protein n=1 Tax=Lepeophtheirus salmonis TaxID=72036 RepID=A0A0K2UV48_LEPSM